MLAQGYPVRAEGVMAEPDEFLLAAMREVDALTPSCPPIAPPTRRRASRALEMRREQVAAVAAAEAQHEALRAQREPGRQP